MTDIDTASELVETCWHYLVLGIVQGLTEFLPISSTAHLKVIPMVLGWGDPGVSTTAVIQLGSILAVITYFRNDLHQASQGIKVAIQRGQWREPNARLGIAIGLGTLPIVVAGFLIKFFWADFDTSPIREVPSIAFISIVMALFLALAERKGRRLKVLSAVSGKDGLLIGLSQALALIPGVSRSGITLTTSLLNDWKRQDAARFSFLLGIPAISLAGIVELKNGFNNQNPSVFLPIVIGITSAAIVSWLSIDWLMKYLQSHRTWLFVCYRLIFGCLLLFWWLQFQSN